MNGTLFDTPDPGDEPPGRELGGGRLAADEVEATVADVVMPVALDPGRVLPTEVGDGLDEIDALRTLRAAAEAREFALIGHTATIAPPPAQHKLAGGERLVDLGGDGCPLVAEFIVVEIAALLHTTHTAARGLIADALSAQWRHPRMFAAVMAGRLPVWQARRIAQAVRWAGLTRPQALQIDRRLAPALGAVSWTRLEALVEGEIVTADPARAAEAEQRARTGRFARVTRDEIGQAGVRTLIARLATPEAVQLDATLSRLAGTLTGDGEGDSLDVRRSRALGLLATPERAAALLAGDTVAADRHKPPVRLYVHVNAERLDDQGVARLEGEGAVPVAALRALLADSTVRVTGVIDHRTSEPIDAYEIPERLREQLILAQPYEIFPFGSHRSRYTDLDHTEPYRATPPDPTGRGAPPGQTRIDNLGPLSRTAHRAKTHAGWRCRQTAPGHWLWRTPYGREYLVDNWGTHTPDQPAAPEPSDLELDAIHHLTAPPGRQRAAPGMARRGQVTAGPRPRPHRRPRRPERSRRSGRRRVGRPASRRRAPASRRRSS